MPSDVILRCIFLSLVSCAGLVSPSCLIEIFAPFLVLGIQISKMWHHCRIIGRYVPLVCLHRTFARLAGIPWCLPISVPWITNFSAIRELESTASSIESLAAQCCLWSNYVPRSQVFAEPSECFDTSTFTSATGFRLVLSSAFVIDYQWRGTKYPSSEALVWWHPIALGRN